MLVVIASASLLASDSYKDRKYFDYRNFYGHKKFTSTQVGQRPSFLIDGMNRSALKTKLKRCERGPFYPSDFSIGHRGAPMQFPEHTAESYIAAARQGAGIIECDVTFTSDGELVCRHAECDLHTTTNIIATDLNNKCSVPWDENNPNPGSVKWLCQ